MRYTINYFKRERLERAEHLGEATLDECRAVANDTVTSGTVDRVEIRDEQGTLVFQWPRTIHA